MLATEQSEADGPPSGGRRFTRHWRRGLGLASLVGLLFAAFTMADSTDGRDLPGLGPMAIGFVCCLGALIFSAQAWIALFPAGANRLELARALYTSQLAKYLPLGGGVVQTVSQVALSSQQGGAAGAAVRMPVFALSTVAAGATWASSLVFESELDVWQRVLAGLGLTSVLLLDRRLLHTVLKLLNRLSARVPAGDVLPPQSSIIQCYLFSLGTLLLFATGFAVLLRDVADVNAWTAGAGLCAAWVIGYLVVVVPGGVVVREAALWAILPGVSAATIVTASVAHRLLGLLAEATMAGLTHLRTIVAGRTRVPEGRQANDADPLNTSAKQRTTID